jgi:hypothetical protein
MDLDHLRPRLPLQSELVQTHSLASMISHKLGSGNLGNPTCVYRLGMLSQIIHDPGFN